MQIAMRAWPGLERLWYRGDFHSLLVAILFGWVTALSFLATFVWPEWISSYLGNGIVGSVGVSTVWLGLIVSCLLSLIKTSVLRNVQAIPTPEACLNSLVEAQEHYLQANYFEAERLLTKNLSSLGRDIESSLLLVSVFRRTRRVQEGLEMIAELERLDAASPWLAELKDEKEACLRWKIQSVPPAHE